MTWQSRFGVRILLTAVVAWAYDAAPRDAVEAQVMGAADVGISHDLTWRGLRRARGISIQPAAVAGFRTTRWMASAGVWANLDAARPSRTAPGTALVLGDPWSELNAWAQLDWRPVPGIVDLATGFVTYAFYGDTAAGGRGPASNTTEIFARAKLTLPGPALAALRLPALPVAFDLTGHIDVGTVGGVYGELAAESDLPVLPFGEPLGAILVRIATGWSWGQDHGDASSVHYEGGGPTHLDFSTTGVFFFPLGGAALTVHAAPHLQLGFDGATRLHGPGADDRSTVRFWAQATVSLIGPLRRIP